MTAAMPTHPRALVTGASSGLGAEFARQLAERGHDLALLARRRDALDELAMDLRARGASTLVLAIDLAAADAEQRVAAGLAAAGWNALDLLVNNAGFGRHGAFAATAPAELDAMIAVNVRAVTGLTRALLPAMLQQGRGRILNVASTAAFAPGPGMAVYYATKAFVLSWSEALAVELRGSGVTVTCLCPGPVATGFQQRAGLDGARPVRGTRLMAADTVVACGLRAAARGHPVAIPGSWNRLLASSIRFAPRGLVARIVGWMQGQR
jgi:hypothetical protein